MLGGICGPAQHAAREIDRDIAGAEVGNSWHCTAANSGQLERTPSRLHAAQSRAVALRAADPAHQPCRCGWASRERGLLRYDRLERHWRGELGRARKFPKAD